MEVRKVQINFADSKVHSNPASKEYSQMLNAISTHIPYLEGLLVKTVDAAKRKLEPSDIRLIEDAEIFNAQEGRHTLNQLKFNKILRNSGYPKLPEFERSISADFDRIAARGHKFALAYCEGFETSGPIIAQFFFKKAAPLMKDWDEATVYLWLWHFAEEFEHRTVCNYLYKRLYGSYIARIYGLFYCQKHLGNYTKSVCDYLISEDNKNMPLAKRMASSLRLFRLRLQLKAFVLPRLLFALRPGYDPGKIEMPAEIADFLANASKRWGVAH